MVQKSFHELPADERAEFEAACTRHGFVREDFDVSAEEGLPLDGGPHSHHIHRKITVARVTRSEIQIYPAGPGTSWTVAFERDLEQDVFGFPLAD